jgi:predicted RNA-binding protein (virulence factor B family)
MVTANTPRIYIGDTMAGYIQRFTEDGKITLNLTPVGYKGIMKSESPAAIMQKLEDAGGYLPYGDKSDPEDIRREFGMSKKTFKKILGTLFREGKIVLSNDGFRKN